MTQPEQEAQVLHPCIFALANCTCWSKAAVRVHHDKPALHTPDYPLQTHTMASPPPVEDQARLLEDALAVVRQQTLLMKRCLETPGKLMDALKCR